nr:BCCT family transporter [uncultured Halomonas sp.]
MIVAIFFAISSDSASLVVDMLCTGSADPGPWHQRVFWGVSEGMLATMLIVLTGDAGLTAFQEVITMVGLLMFILVFALYRGLMHEDPSEVRAGSLPR